MADRPVSFVAFPELPREVSDTILAAIECANKAKADVCYVPWTASDIAGKQIVSPIVENIERSTA